MSNFSIRLGKRIVEALENAPKVRRIIWGILAVIAFYGIPSIIQSITPLFMS